MVDSVSRQPKLAAASSVQEPSFGSGVESTVEPASSKRTEPEPGNSKPAESKSTPEQKPRKPQKSETKDEPAQLSFSAVKMLADRYPAFIADANNLRSKNESRYVLSVIVFIIISVIAAWVVWEQRYFHTDGDFVYYMGLTGGILMLLTLLFAFRKRVKFMRKMGNLNAWYYAHLFAGVVGPVLIIFHSSFSMKALNSTVALISMLCVIASGIVGRYIYTRIGYRVHQHLIELRDTDECLATSMQAYKSEATDEIEKYLKALTLLAVNMPSSLIKMPGRFFTLRTKAARCYVTGIQHISLKLKQRAAQEKWDKLTCRTELVKEKRILRKYVNALVQIGKFHVYERMLLGWRIFHIPLIFILLISGSVHVFAVHWY